MTLESWILIAAAAVLVLCFIGWALWPFGRRDETPSKEAAPDEGDRRKGQYRQAGRETNAPDTMEADRDRPGRHTNDAGADEKGNRSGKQHGKAHASGDPKTPERKLDDMRHTGDEVTEFTGDRSSQAVEGMPPTEGSEQPASQESGVAASGELETLRGTVEDLQTEISQVKEMIEGLARSAENGSRSKEPPQVTQKSLIESIAGLQDRFDGFIDKEKQNSEERAEALREAKDAAKRERDELEGTVAELAQTRDRLEEQRSALTKEQGRLQEERDDLVEERDRLERRHDEIQRAREEAEEERDETREKLSTVQDELQAAQGRLKRSESLSEDLQQTIGQYKNQLKYARSTPAIGELFDRVQQDQVTLFDDWRGDLKSFASFSCLVNYSLLRWVQATLGQRPEETRTAMQHNLEALMRQRDGAFQESLALLQEERQEQSGGPLPPPAEGTDPRRTAAIQKMLRRLRDQQGMSLSPFYVDVDENDAGKEMLVLQ